MNTRKTNAPYTTLAISLAFSGVLLVGGMTQVQELDGHLVLSKLLWPLLRLLIFISAGLFAGQIIEATGWTRSLAALASPLFRFGKLNQRCSAAFTTAFVSGVAANAMLLDFYKEGKITKREVFLTNFINQLPAYFLHLPTTIFIVIPLTGQAGGLYFLMTFVAVAIRTTLLLLYGHFAPSLPDSDSGTEEPSRGRNHLASSGIWEGIKSKFPKRIMHIAMYVVPIYIFVFVIHAMGVGPQ